MTPQPDKPIPSTLVERLRAEEPSGYVKTEAEMLPDGSMEIRTDGQQLMRLRNPDGPEAANEIERLQALTKPSPEVTGEAVEAVAAALARNEYEGANYERYTEEAKDEWRDKARAAIAAYRSLRPSKAATGLREALLKCRELFAEYAESGGRIQPPYSRGKR